LTYKTGSARLSLLYTIALHVLYHNKNIGFIIFHRIIHENKKDPSFSMEKLSLQHNWAIDRPISKN